MFCCSANQRIRLGLLRWWSLAACPNNLQDSSLLILKAFSTSPCSSTKKEASKPLKQWTLVVNPFSKVRVQLQCHISVRPLDPHAFPEANRAFITIHGTSADQAVQLDNFQVHYDDQNKELYILSEVKNSNVSVELTAPIKSDLYITTQGEGDVHVQKMECDTCRVQTERGNCVLHSVKGHQVQVHSQGGNVTGVGTIHGNVDISTSGHSAVNVKKIQGTTMNVSTEHGPLKVKAIYAESTTISSSSGRIQLGHIHGDATVRNETGDIIVGAVSVRVHPSIRAGVQLCGMSVEISPEIVLQQAERDSKDSMTTVTGHMNGQPQGDQWIRAQADRGSVTLKAQSWFESLKLGS
ncbi:protein FAM185A isoform X2 [Salvelinus alpinus]|uniref:protein FAM185A isoform X2 n=1 Tax=Salvelinus alpinus TaxID=8036 RepID=UPI0039FBF9E6